MQNRILVPVGGQFGGEIPLESSTGVGREGAQLNFHERPFLEIDLHGGRSEKITGQLTESGIVADQQQ